MIIHIKKNKQIIYFLSVLRQSRQIVLTTVCLSVVADVIARAKSSDIRIFGILGAFILCLWIYKLSSIFIFKLCILLLVMMLAAFILGNSPSTEKAAVWFFLFLGMGIIRQWKE